MKSICVYYMIINTVMAVDPHYQTLMDLYHIIIISMNMDVGRKVSQRKVMNIREKAKVTNVIVNIVMISNLSKD